MDIVILHDPTDARPIVERLAQDLASAENKVWYDRRETVPVLDVSMVIEVAIKRADCVIMCLSPNCADSKSIMHRYSRMARISRKPIIAWQAANIPLPSLLAHVEPLAAYNDWSTALSKLQTELVNLVYIEPTTPDPAEDDPYFDVLIKQKKQLENLLIRSVFNLQVWNGGLTDLDKAQSYSVVVNDGATSGDFPEMWTQHSQQAIVTGEAGSGKSILLMGIAYHAIFKRLQDPSARVPHYIELYQWDGQDNIFNNMAGIDEALFILDGLNEVRQNLDNANTEIPLDLRLEVWENFQQSIPAGTPIILSGTTADYQILARSFDAIPVQLAIQPLADTLIQTSLSEQTGLWEYVQKQSTLKEVIGLPFYLTLYRAQEDPEALDLSDETRYEVQDTLIDSYIEARAESSSATTFTTEEILEGMQKVLWDLLTGANRREYVELWSQNLQTSLGKQTREVTETLLAWGLIIPVREGIARFVHSHVYRYFIFDGLTERFLEGFTDEKQGAIQAFTRYIEPQAIEILIVALDSGDIDLVQNAALALGNLGDARAVPSLIKAISAWVGERQVTIALALGKIADKRAVPTFIDILTTEQADDEVRAALAWGLGRMDDVQAISALQSLIQDEDWTVSIMAIEALGKIKATDAVPELVILLDDIDDDIRRYVVEALGRIGDNRATHILIEHLDDPHPMVRAEICRSLQKLGDTVAVEHIIDILDDEDPIVCQTAAQSLRKMGADIIPNLVHALAEIESEEISYSLAQVLGQFGQPAVPALLEVLDNDNPHVRSSAAQALGWIGGNASLTALLDLLNNDDNVDVRISAVNGMGWIGDIAAQDDLVAHLTDDDTDLVMSLLQVLHEIGDERAIEHIEPLTSSSDEMVRRLAEGAIWHLEADDDEDED